MAEVEEDGTYWKTNAKTMSLVLALVFQFVISCWPKTNIVKMVHAYKYIYTYCNIQHHMSKPGFCLWNEMLSYDILEKECEFSFDMIYYLFFHALSIQSFEKNLICFIQ